VCVAGQQIGIDCPDFGEFSLGFEGMGLDPVRPFLSGRKLSVKLQKLIGRIAGGHAYS